MARGGFHKIPLARSRHDVALDGERKKGVLHVGADLQATADLAGVTGLEAQRDRLDRQRLCRERRVPGGPVEDWETGLDIPEIWTRGEEHAACGRGGRTDIESRLTVNEPSSTSFSILRVIGGFLGLA